VVGVEKKATIPILNTQGTPKLSYLIHEFTLKGMRSLRWSGMNFTLFPFFDLFVKNQKQIN